MKYIEQFLLGCQMDEKPWWDAVSYGKTEILQWLFDNDYDSTPFGQSTAASEGHIEVLQWLDANRFTLEWRELNRAAIAGGHREIEDWTLAKMDEKRLSHNKRGDLIPCFVESHQFERLKTEYTKDEILEKLTNYEIHYCFTGDKKDIVILKWWVEEMGGKLPKTVKNNHGGEEAGLEVWEYLVQQGCILTSENLSTALACQNIELIRWLLSQGLKVFDYQEIFNESVSDIALLEWYRKEVGPLMWNELSFTLCATVEEIKWALANGCPEPEDKLAYCISVSEYSWNFDLLQWAVKQGWPINEEVAIKVANHGVVAHLKWILEKLEPGRSKKKELPVEIIKMGVGSNKLEMILWLEKRGDIMPFVDNIIPSSMSRQSWRTIKWLGEKGLLSYENLLSDSHDPRIRQLIKKHFSI